MSAPSAARWSAYFSPPQLLDGFGLRCLGAGSQSGPVTRIERRVLDHNGAVLVTRGAGDLVSDGQRHQVTHGSLFWIFPGVEHSYGPGPGGWAERWVLFHGPAAQAFERLGLLDRTRPVVKSTARGEIWHLFSRIEARAQMRTPMAQADLAVAIQQLVLAAANGTSSAPHGASQLISKLRDEAVTGSTIQAIAAAMNLSPTRFRDIVRAQTGQTPKAYVTAVRLDAARSLLTDTDEPIKVIARRCGYEDPSYFTRAFTRGIGMSPQKFRKQYRR